MTAILWPHSVRGGDGRLLKDAYRYDPPDVVLVSDMEIGEKRRLRTTKGWARRRARLRLPMGEADRFEHWVRTELANGVRRFNWQPPEMRGPALSRFVIKDGRAFSKSPAPGANVFIDFEIESLS